jgi:glycosyltransferase involved in cell wall biosynthesis
MHTPEPEHGMAQYVSEIVIALAKSGVRVVLFCPENFNEQEKLRAAGVQIEHAAFRAVSNAGLVDRIMRNLRFAAKSALTEFRLVRSGDVVHFQGVVHLPLGFLFFLVAMLRGASIVLTVHDPLPHRWRLPGNLSWFERKMLEASYHLSEDIIIHNQEGKNLMVREFHIRESSVSVIPHGHYWCNADQAGNYPPFDCLRLLVFGSIRENKGTHLAIQATQTVNAIAGVPVHLTIAGSPCNAAEQQYWRDCKELISTNPDNIEVIERHIANDEIGSLFAQHHAVLLPYTDFHSESGVASLALSHRRPIVATTAGGLGELMRDGACGIPILSADAEAVRLAILTAVSIGAERLQLMGIKGSEFMHQTRSWHSVARQTTAVYNHVVSRRAG